MLNANYIYKTKKELKAAVGQRLKATETSMFGPEKVEDGKVLVVGPCAHTRRRWYAEVHMQDGKIKSVK